MTSTVILSDNGALSGSAGLKSQAGNDGTLVIQTTTAGGTATTAMTLGTDQSVTFAQAANLPNTFGFKNRIINGAMVIDQRNAGASVTLTAAGLLYPVDRFFSYRSSGTTGATAQQISSGITGGKNAVRIQRTAGNTATDTLIIGQVLETNNSYDFAGQSVTLSFQARCGANFSASGSQITARVGTGTGTDQSAANFANNAWTGQSNTNSVVTLTTSWQTFTLTISAGSSVTQAGVLFFWAPSGTAGASDFVDITNVQLEKGSTATSFDFRSYGTELMLCQRYCEIGYFDGVGVYISAAVVSIGQWINFAVAKRTNSMSASFSTGATYSSATGTWTSQASGGTTTSRTVGINSQSYNGWNTSWSGSDPRINGYWWFFAEL